MQNLFFTLPSPKFVLGVLDLESEDQKKTAAAAPPPPPPKTHHILVVDCSGSMSGDLPSLRAQIKNKIPSLMNEGDCLSLVWFSGRGQAGTIFEAVEVKDLGDLVKVQSKVDQWLRPVGCTGFVDPLKETSRIIASSRKKNPAAVVSVLFMSDGYDNESGGNSPILKALDTVNADTMAVVEYGYYANRALLSEMAERVGGAHIFADSFGAYTPVVEKVLRSRGTPATKVKEVTFAKSPFLNFAVALRNGEIVTYKVEENRKTLVPEDVKKLFFLVEGSFTAATFNKNETNIQGVYALISALSVRMKPEAVFPLLAITGDVKFIKDFSGCYGKQRYSSFMTATKEAVFDPSKRLTQGFDPLAVPDENAFTVLDVIRILSNDPKAKLLLDHPEFSYNAISRGRVSVDDTLTPEEQAEIADITAKMAANAKNKKMVHELSTRLNEITAKQGLHFKADKNEAGYSLRDLTYNESRANISVLVRKAGSVDISGKLPHNLLDKLPKSFPTHVFRNYALVKDGMINVKRLPVTLSKESLDEIVLGDSSTLAEAPQDHNDGTLTAILELGSLPILNRAMVKAVSAKNLFNLEYALHKAQSEAKVFNGLLKEQGVEKKESVGFIETYGPEAAEWLKENGFSEYNGFSPKKTTQADATDKYVTREIKVSLSGYSSLPSLNDVRTKVASKKVNAAGEAMAGALANWNAQLTNGSIQDPKDWLRTKAEEATKKSRGLLAELAKVKFGIIVGQVWPTEFSSIEENTLSLTSDDGKTLNGKIEVKDVTVEILDPLQPG